MHLGVCPQLVLMSVHLPMQIKDRSRDDFLAVFFFGKLITNLNNDRYRPNTIIFLSRSALRL